MFTFRCDKICGGVNLSKKIWLALMTTAFAVLLVSSVQASTVLNLNWNNGGIITANMDTGDAVLSFQSNADMASGSLWAKDYDDNPYGYGVDGFKTEISSYVSNGFTEYSVQRTDSKESMYGPADQSTYSFLGSSGSGSLTFSTSTNYAALRSSNYGYQANDQFVASGDYLAYHEVVNGDNEAWWEASGSGSLDVDHMADDTWTSQIQFGFGDGCYKNADVTQIGSGYYSQGAVFGNSFTQGGSTASGVGTYSYQVTFASGFSWSDTSFELD